MSQPHFDYAKAVARINRAPALAETTVALGKHVLRLEKITTIYHGQYGCEHYVFRVFIDGQRVFDQFGDAAFVSPSPAMLRQYGIPTVFGFKPDWMPRGVTMKAANRIFDNAMRALL